MKQLFLWMMALFILTSCFWSTDDASPTDIPVATGSTQDITAPAESYWPNQYDMYNVKGNMSEWLLEKNTHVGGAWNTHVSEDVSQKMKLEKASATIGFRCVCEIAEEAP